MKTDIDIKDDVWAIVNGSPLHKAIKGALRKTKRPTELGEDIVISVLANEMGQSQEAYVNVNIYTPETLRENQYEEKTSRVRELCDLSTQLFQSIHGDGFRLTLDTQRTMEVEATNETLINNKLLYQIINE